jgi:hypothetical protein
MDSLPHPETSDRRQFRRADAKARKMRVQVPPPFHLFSGLDRSIKITFMTPWIQWGQVWFLAGFWGADFDPFMTGYFAGCRFPRAHMTRLLICTEF